LRSQLGLTLKKSWGFFKKNWHDDASTSQVAVLGYEFRHRRFGAASDAIGKDIRIEGRPFMIVGITRKWFTGMTTGEPPEVTLPVTAQPLIQCNDFKINDRSILWVFVTGRLKDGFTILGASAAPIVPS
jgi:hypothetical protein